MSRETLLRGKRVDNGEWVVGYPYQIKSKGLWFIDDGYTVSHQVIPETIGQYTGLNDKNGVEIYEGDILKRQGEVRLGLYNYTFRGLYGNYPIFGCGYYTIKHYDISPLHTKYEYEVIGNIHDNKLEVE